MYRNIRLSIATAAGLFIAMTGLAGAAERMIMIGSDQAVKWGPAPASLPKGTQISVLSGNPDQPGPFVLRLKIAANTIIAPHTHNTAENVTVLSGQIVHETGNILVRSKGETMDVGGFVYLPANMAHSLWTNAQSAEIQVTGTGPFGLNYINKQDDPRNAN